MKDFDRYNRVRVYRVNDKAELVLLGDRPCEIPSEITRIVLEIIKDAGRQNRGMFVIFRGDWMYVYRNGILSADGMLLLDKDGNFARGMHLTLLRNICKKSKTFTCGD